MDAAYISALSALGGATIGGLASFGSSWLTQRTQLRFAHYEAIKAKREGLYAEFIDEACRLYGDALGHQKDEVADLVKIYALVREGGGGSSWLSSAAPGPKVRRLLAGGEWIRNFSSAMPRHHQQRGRPHFGGE